MSAQKKYEIDMCNGPMFGKILLFALPLIATFMLQLLFNAADLIVIGRYAHSNSMAAIGATISLNALLINLFGGLAVGTNVIVAKAIGEKNPDNIHKAVHTSIMVAIIGGVILTIVALLVAKPILILMKTPENILPLSCKYLWICFCAIPFIMVYNFSCSILRAVGDTRRPLIILSIAGLFNVGLNFLFVAYLGMDVAGVALATAISHALSAILVIRILIKSRENYQVITRALKVDFKMFRKILKIGLPAGVASSCFALSNMLIQSSINSFGPIVMAAMTVAISIEGIIYTGSFAFNQTTVSFVAQNYGAMKYKRVLASFRLCSICSFFICTVTGLIFLFFGEQLLSMFTQDPEVIPYGILRMKYLFVTYGLCGLMDVGSGGLRGLGYSVTATIMSMAGACFFRIFWVMVILPHCNSLENLLLSYPISWALTALISMLAFHFIFRHLAKSLRHPETPWINFSPGISRGIRFILGSK